MCQLILRNYRFNSSLYTWTLTLGNNSALKQAIDSVLCAFCYVRPSLLILLLEWVQILSSDITADHPTTSTSDDYKKSGEQIDDKKCKINVEEWYCQLALLKHKRLHLTEGQLLTVAAAARSSPGIQQLIDSGLPALLTTSITGSTFFKILCLIIK